MYRCGAGYSVVIGMREDLVQQNAEYIISYHWIFLKKGKILPVNKKRIVWVLGKVYLISALAEYEWSDWRYDRPDVMMER